MIKKALLACNLDWQSPFRVGSHQLALGLINQGWRVAYISSPISPFHFVGSSREMLQSRFRDYRNGGEFYFEKRLWTYVPGTFLPPHNKPLLRREWVHRNWYRLSLPNIITKIYQSGFADVDLLYFDNPYQPFLLDHITYKKSIFRIPDNAAGFSKFNRTAKLLEKELARRVDKVLYTARKLTDYAQSLNPKDSLFFPNGVNFEHFSRGDRTIPAEFNEISGPIVLYVGALDFWFDFELINYAAEKLPRISFVLIGQPNQARARLRGKNNIHLLGTREFAELPGFMHNADVGIIPFNAQDFPELIHAVNPLKLYEYMACGLPVVATEWDELRSIQSPAFLAANRADFVSQIEKALRVEHDTDSFIEYAKAKDWQHKIIHLLDLLELAR